PQIKQLVALRDASKTRKQTGQAIVEGLRECMRALQAGVVFDAAYLCFDFDQGKAHSIVAELEARGTPYYTVSAKAFEKASGRDNPDGVLAVLRTPLVRLEDLQVNKDPLFVIVEGVEKPGNLGSLIRSVEATGATGLIVCDPVVDLWSPQVIRNSQGAVFSLPIALADKQAVLAFIKTHQLRTVATSPDAVEVFWDADLRGPLALLMGSESLGLTAFWMDACDLQVKIPMHGQADSLNLGTATALMLYEALRQRR
ncbi:MAG: hypothetical protein B7X06_04225, partial [Verrucomicrobia bacterium 21-51-4]